MFIICSILLFVEIKMQIEDLVKQIEETNKAVALRNEYKVMSLFTLSVAVATGGGGANAPPKLFSAPPPVFDNFRRNH